MNIAIWIPIDDNLLCALVDINKKGKKINFQLINELIRRCDYYSYCKKYYDYVSYKKNEECNI